MNRKEIEQRVRSWLSSLERAGKGFFGYTPTEREAEAAEIFRAILEFDKKERDGDPQA